MSMAESESSTTGQHVGLAPLCEAEAVVRFRFWSLHDDASHGIWEARLRKNDLRLDEGPKSSGRPFLVPTSTLHDDDHGIIITREM
ncbi:hypothetical protein EUGRSUZ_G02898 [Eucalyptus grandis]|uniref:Uncharacterized protein n=2 Tax=Eucalyptus grandis TaxID=71139 RepID=A0ACC3KA88_EUCGR|nr:hypothetical protein EUGRSUZ_G02898 [Eucalyptus grandis]